MKAIAVFCGSSTGNNGNYKKQAILLGQMLAKKNIDLVYGGAKVGLMGAIAEGALNDGGQVIGVLPTFLKSKEIAHSELTELILVESMHERKNLMHEMSDGVIALPGGFGTMEELFEMLTWSQLGLHEKPIGILNIDGFYDPLISLLENMVAKGLLKQKNREMLLIDDNINSLLSQMEKYVAPYVPKWIDEEKI
ncbi:MAG: TIGR00730 family Rossman fold protein [Bacteroidota bacterium]|nr:TIGR00730 family Rossman fold protein [Bacteroidota bacterium]